MHRWRGRPALVTGASVGIGRSVAISLLRHGLNVVACARRVDAVRSIEEEVSGEDVGKLSAIQCDLRKAEDIWSMFRQIKESRSGDIDICINNAGLGLIGSLISGKTEEWRAVLDVNVLGLSICTTHALQSMKERGVDDGHIINISSTAAYHVSPRAAMYSASKFAVRALTEGLRRELLETKSGIRVTQISPGIVDTEIFKVALGVEQGTHLMATREHMVSQDVVDAVEFALSAPRHAQVHDLVLHPIGFPPSSSAR